MIELSAVDDDGGIRSGGVTAVIDAETESKLDLRAVASALLAEGLEVGERTGNLSRRPTVRRARLPFRGLHPAFLGYVVPPI